MKQNLRLTNAKRYARSGSVKHAVRRALDARTPFTLFYSTKVCQPCKT